jgi:N-acetylglutamate synthase-like GNAT family acetyltransferase
MISYRFITTQDPEYILEKELRNRVLRRPLGLELSEADLCGEDEQVHIAAVDDAGRVIGCVLVAFTGEQAKIRQIAVDEAWRGKKIGPELIHRAEAAAREQGLDRVTLHARVVSRGFFEKLGYRTASDIFTEVTIPHVKMEKDL